MTTAVEHLVRDLNDRFSDDSRSMVLIVGSGLHHHLHSHGVRLPDGPAGASLRDWNSLLRAARRKGKVDEFSTTHHDDATATWESMLEARGRAVPGQLASQHERVLHGRVGRTIRTATPKKDDLKDLGAALAKLRFRDIVTVNFDPTLSRAISAKSGANGTVVYNPSGKGHLARSTLHIATQGTRIWHPHGLVESSVGTKTLQLGMVQYSKSVGQVRAKVDAFRGAQVNWRTHRHGGPPPKSWTALEAKAWLEHVRGTTRHDSTWIDQVLVSNLVFLGCGLDRAEADLWLLLHERQRQLLRVPPKERPRTYFLHPLSRFPAHLTTGPANIIPIATSDYDEAWRLVLGKWWS